MSHETNIVNCSNSIDPQKDTESFIDLKEIARQTNPDITSLNDLKIKINEFNKKKLNSNNNDSLSDHEISNKQNQPILIDNDQDKENQEFFFTKFKVIRFMIVSAMKLKLEDLTLATAAVIFHKFFKTCKLKDFDPYLIATASIYLASKVEEQEIKLRDIINVCYRTLHSYLDPLDISDKYWSIRKSVIQIELLIVRVLLFRLDFEHPHEYLLVYLEQLRHWIPLEKRQIAPIPETSWHILRDLLHSDLYLKYRPQDIAISIIYFVCICYGVKIPHNELAQKNWWKALDEKTTKSSIHEIIGEILNIYELEDQIGTISFN